MKLLLRQKLTIPHHKVSDKLEYTVKALDIAVEIAYL